VAVGPFGRLVLLLPQLHHTLSSSWSATEALASILTWPESGGAATDPTPASNSIGLPEILHGFAQTLFTVHVQKEHGAGSKLTEQAEHTTVGSTTGAIQLLVLSENYDSSHNFNAMHGRCYKAKQAKLIAYLASLADAVRVFGHGSGYSVQPCSNDPGEGF